MALTVHLNSFSYIKSGIPDDHTGHGGGFVFDCRFINNPGRKEEFKSLTGQQKEVIAFLESQEEMNKFLNNVYDITDPAIENYIERKGLGMQESPTGLWYFLRKEGRGNLISDNKKVRIAYECSLLDGTKCYSSDDSGPKEIVLGKTGIEQGLYEGLKMLRPGAEAIFIIPPFLGHGLIGDGRKIPPRAVIVYEVKVLSVE